MTLRLLSLISSGDLGLDYRRIAETINQLIGDDANAGTAFEAAYALPENTSTPQYVHLGTWSPVAQEGAKLAIDITTGNGFNAVVTQNAQYSLFFKTSNGISFQAGSSGNFYGDGEAWARGGAALAAITQFLVIQNSPSSYDFYAHCAAFSGFSFYRVATAGGTWIDSSELVGTGTPAGNNIALAILATTNGSFVASTSGFSTAVTTPVTWILNNIAGIATVTLTIGSFSGISNSGFFSINGLPASIQPATGGTFMPVPAHIIEDNGARQDGVSAAASGGTLSLYLNGLINGWTSTGTKGLLQNITLSYPLT